MREKLDFNGRAVSDIIASQRRAVEALCMLCQALYPNIIGWVQEA